MTSYWVYWNLFVSEAIRSLFVAITESSSQISWRNLSVPLMRMGRVEADFTWYYRFLSISCHNPLSTHPCPSTFWSHSLLLQRGSLSMQGHKTAPGLHFFSLVTPEKRGNNSFPALEYTTCSEGLINQARVMGPFLGPGVGTMNGHTIRITWFERGGINPKERRRVAVSRICGRYGGQPKTADVYNLLNDDGGSQFAVEIQSAF